MESRKIQTVGGGTYTVSLPKPWARDHGLEGGSVVDIYTHIDGVLVVEAEEPAGANERVTVTVSEDDPVYLERTLRAAYAAGASAVTFDCPDEFTGPQRQRIESVAREMPGVTVAEASATRIAVRALLDPDEVSIVQSVRQLSFVALSMHRDATAALTAEHGPDLADRDDQADRLAAMVDRHVGRGIERLDEVDALGLTRPELFELWTTARELERVADHAERIGTVAAATTARSGLVEDVVDLAAMARTVVEDGVQTVVDGAGVPTAREALAGRDRVRERTATIERRLFDAPDANGRLVRILDSIERTAEHGGNVAETGLRAAVRCDELPGSDTPDESSSPDTVAEGG